MTDNLEYIVSPGVVPAGPKIWEITNTGMHHSHHVVMFGVPDGVTAENIIAEFSALFAGTPPAEPSISANMTGARYAALQSGGQTTWNEFDLAPGTYALICFIVDIETGRPHLMDGMVTTFTVEWTPAIATGKRRGSLKSGPRLSFSLRSESRPGFPCTLSQSGRRGSTLQT